MTTKIVNHKKDDAVSPVVGVMLMLVVTIVIAAVVALFATSVVTDTNAAPVAVIQMDAYAGEPDVNQNLCMSIIGGKALELSKLKCVVTIDDGKYGLVFKSLDTDPVVGKFLEIGEKLEIFNFDNGGMRKINSLVGGDIKTQEKEFVDKVHEIWEVGNKVNVMIVFDENAILYKRDIIIQDGNHGGVIVNPDLKNGSIAIAEKDGSEIATITPDSGYSIKADSVQVINTSTGADVSTALNLTKVTNGDAETWMFDKPTVPVMVTCVFETEAAKETFNVVIPTGLLSDGDIVKILAGDSTLFTYTAGSSKAKNPIMPEYETVGSFQVPVNTEIKVTIKEDAPRLGSSYSLHTLTAFTASDAKQFVANEDLSKDYSFSVEYTIAAGDVGTGTDPVSGTKNPIIIDSGSGKRPLEGVGVTLNTVEGITKYQYKIGKAPEYKDYNDSFFMESGNSITLLAVVDDTHTFVSWDDAGTLTSNPYTIESVTKNLDFTPKVEAK